MREQMEVMWKLSEKWRKKEYMYEWAGRESEAKLVRLSEQDDPLYRSLLDGVRVGNAGV